TKTNIFPTNLQPECAGNAPQKEKILRPECGAEAPTFLSAVYKRGTQAKKRQAYAPQYGRSMIEMLGVLAIIGVLTVGSITGYSHAMRRHLLNKQREQYSYILSAVETHRNAFFSLPDMSLKETFSTFGWIPEEMIQDDTHYIYDVFKNRIGIHKSHTYTKFLNVSIIFNKDTRFLEQCTNLYQTVQPYHSTIWYIQSMNTGAATYYGDSFCHPGNCIKDLTLKQISEVCGKACNQNQCRLDMLWMLENI
ncbi:MAG: hypothetical protein IJ852_00325, partial [Alphaproteobacteria bacterium]|nr:hypothetical protein [Alphaproteobacteria bacterium]